ncbi:hypothetical protein, partial [Shewanella dokdonensis]|uniref:hypothetical protein n=1 Tax=Shewanella dokdonensis TaxID=712036 RepID=UPI00200EC79F
REVHSTPPQLGVKWLAPIFFAQTNQRLRLACLHRQRVAVAVSVGAHYRGLNLLCKRYFKEKRSLADLLGKSDLFMGSS